MGKIREFLRKFYKFIIKDLLNSFFIDKKNKVIRNQFFTKRLLRQKIFKISNYGRIHNCCEYKSYYWFYSKRL